MLPNAQQALQATVDDVVGVVAFKEKAAG